MSKRTFNGYGNYWSDACLPKGNGQCDGFVPEDEQDAGQECGCPCHNAWPGDEFSEALTTTQMEAAHRNYWKDEEDSTPEPDPLQNGSWGAGGPGTHDYFSFGG